MSFNYDETVLSAKRGCCRLRRSEFSKRFLLTTDDIVVASVVNLGKFFDATLIETKRRPGNEAFSGCKGGVSGRGVGLILIKFPCSENAMGAAEPSQVTVYIRD